MMTPEQYRKAGEIYHAALAVPPDRRADFIERACAGDHDLAGEVESLLAAHDDAGEFIESPPAELGSLLAAVLDSSAPGRQDSEAPEGAHDGSREGPLAPGRRLGRYEVVDLLGAGGMGTVYRAVDSTLGREVAIKALAPTFRGNSASLRRFEREARVLATLSHPNIATIYGFERLEGSPYLVLERVDGETLADRLQRGAMPLDVALDVAHQIVAGLEEAHGKGITHRDLKPSNVMLTPAGQVKLVDFGLAKTAATQPQIDLSGDPITAPGVVLGTARYMSPEQVKGESVDMRTDVWAFGCVLYEMLTARPVFAGRSVSEVVAAVLRDEPDWQALPATVPRNIVRLLRRCLRRDPRTRLQHIGDARLDLVEDENDLTVTPASGTRASGRRRLLVIGAAAAAAAIAALLLWRWPIGAPPPMARLSLELPGGFTFAEEYSPPFAVAPNGSQVVVEALEAGTQRLYVRELTDPALRPLAGTEGARQPFFSPDGAWIGFFASRKLSKVPVGGGPVLQVADVGGNYRGAAWAPDGTIIYAAPQTSGLFRVAESGGKPTPLTTLNKAQGEMSHRWPDVLPGGKWALFTVGFEDAPYDEARIEAVSLQTGERRTLIADAGFARYFRDGRILFVRGGRLHAVRFDPERIALRGTAEVVLDPVRYNMGNGGGHLAVSSSGVLVYGPGEPISTDYYLAWVDREGRLTRASDTSRLFRLAKASPDGRRIATVIGTSADSDLWLVEPNGTFSRLSFGLTPHRPTWTPRGDSITVGSEKNGSWRLLTIEGDGTGAPAVLFESPNRLYPNAWSPDGRFLVFQESRAESGWDLRVLEVGRDGRTVGAPRDFASTPFQEARAALSYDGRWIAYESDELDGVVQVYVRSFPDGARKVRASPFGARWPAWDSQRRLHYFQSIANIFWDMTTIERGGQLVIGKPEPVWRETVAATLLERIVIPLSGPSYDVDASGSRFLVLERTVQGPAPAISNPMIVLGWK